MMSLRWRFRWNDPVHLLLLGLIVRELVAPWTGHPYDLEVWLRNAFYVAQGQNPYTNFMPAVPGLSFAYLDVALPSVGYLPGWSLLVAGLYRFYAAFPGASRFAFYALIKQPTVLADVGLGYALHRTVLRWGGTQDSAVRVLRFWMLFPYPIVIGAVWGQFDPIVVDLILIALLTVSWWSRYASLGLGIFLKWYPLVVVPFLTLRERGFRKLGIVVAVLIPITVTVAVFWAMNWDYVGVTGMAEYTSHGNIGGLTYTSLLAYPSVSAVLSLVPGFYTALGYAWVPGILLGGIWAWRRFPNPDPASVTQGLVLSALAFFLTRQGVNEQYLLYLLPFLLLDVVLWHPERRRLFHLTWALCFSFLLANNDLLVRVLGPVSGGVVDVAYAADASAIVGGFRTFVMYALGILVTITFIQLFIVVNNPDRTARPWPWLIVDRFRGRRAFVGTKPEPDSFGDPK